MFSNTLIFTAALVISVSLTAKQRNVHGARAYKFQPVNMAAQMPKPLSAGIFRRMHWFII